MSSSTVSGDVVAERSCWSSEAVVEADGGCEGEEALADAGAEAVEAAGAVAFEGEQVFAGVEDRFDPLSDRCQAQPGLGFVFAGGSGDERVELAGVVCELAAGVAFVADQGERAGSLDALQQGEASLAFGGFGGCQRERAWGAVEGEQAVQPEAPEVAAVACAVAIVGGVGELAASGRLDAASTLHRGRVDQHQIVVKAGTVTGELLDQRFDRVGQTRAPLVKARPLGQPRKQMREPFAGRLDEPLIRRDAHDRLRDAERNHLRVGQSATGVSLASRQEIVATAINRDQQQVEVGEHRGPLGSTARIGTADFDLTAAGPYKVVELLI